MSSTNESIHVFYSIEPSGRTVVPNVSTEMPCFDVFVVGFLVSGSCFLVLHHRLCSGCKTQEHSVGKGEEINTCPV